MYFSSGEDLDCNCFIARSHSNSNELIAGGKSPLRFNFERSSWVKTSPCISKAIRKRPWKHYEDVFAWRIEPCWAWEFSVDRILIATKYKESSQMNATMAKRVSISNFAPLSTWEALNGENAGKIGIISDRCIESNGILDNYGNNISEVIVTSTLILSQISWKCNYRGQARDMSECWLVLSCPIT